MNEYFYILFFLDRLTKEVEKRANYIQLLEHPFIVKYEHEEVDMAGYVTSVLERYGDLNDNS